MVLLTLKNILHSLWLIQLIQPILVVIFSPQMTMANKEVKPISNRIYVLLVGLSGSGKSSTINVIFNTSIAEVGFSESTTSEIFEYSLSISNFNNTELRVIDTPGLGDTRGLEYDAKFLATLEEYFKTHQELRYRPPDIVLIFSRFDDNRFYGESAQFVKMIKALNSLQTTIVNPIHSNLIFVLTHLMGDEKSAENPEPKKSDVEKAIKDFTIFPTPIRIVLAENKGEDQELEKVDLGYKLPNGEIYPYNLCLAMKEILLLSDTDKGTSNTTSQFMSSVCPGQNSLLTVKLVTHTPLVQLGDIRAKKLLEQLTAANFKTENTEISRQLSNAFTNLTENKNFAPDTLQYLQHALHLRLITKFEDLPITNSEIAKLMRQFKRNDDFESVLKAAFDLQASSLPFLPLLGNGYDISQDSIIHGATPFDLKNCSRYLTPLGYLSPPCVTTTVDSHTKFYYQKYQSGEDYADHRANSLGINKNLLKNCPAILKPGSNLISGKNCPSLLIEFRTLKFELGNVKLSPDFLSKLEDLPQFNISIPDSIQKWNKFLKVYGTHVVTSSYGGGSIDVNTQNYLCSSPGLADIFQNLLKNKQQSETILEPIANLTKLQISGGDYKFFAENPSAFFGKRGGILLFDLWKNSLINQPTTLYNDIKIKPIADFIRASGNSLLADKMSKAVQFFLEDDIKDHPLLSNIRALEIEKNNLAQVVTQVRNEKSEIEKHTLNVTQELSETKRSLQQANLNILTEKGTSASLKQEVADCKTKEAGTRSLLGIEQKRSQYWIEKFSQSTISECGKVLEGSEGVFTYKYASTYSDYERCVWIIRTPKYYSKIRFTKMPTEFESGYDWITVFTFNKGGLVSSSDMGKSSNGIETVLLNGYVAVVVFTTDGSNVKKGFVLHFNAEDLSSSNNYEFHHDYISGSTRGSLKYPIEGVSSTDKYYHHNELSVFVISNSFQFNQQVATNGNKLQITINNGNLENHDSCAYDRLIFYQMGRDRLEGLTTKCGSFNNLKMSSRDLLIAVFATDGSGNGTGFEINWHP